jgi:rhodanese-related sulfurtransferase
LGILELSPAALSELLRAGDAITLLDVREPRERAICAIPIAPTAGDLHITMRQVPAHLDTLKQAGSGGLLVVYCHHGVRSMAVAQWLVERGVPGVANLTGGVDAWSLEVDGAVPRY